MNNSQDIEKNTQNGLKLASHQRVTFSHLVFLSEDHQNIFKNIYANSIRKKFPKISENTQKETKKYPKNAPSSGKYTVKKTISEITIRVIHKASVQALTIKD